VKQKCEKGPEWGTSDSQGENLFKRLARTGVRYKNQGGSAIIAGQSAGRSSGAVDWGDPKKGAGAAADVVIGCKSDEEVMQGVIRAVKGDPDGLKVQGGGVDFVWARMRELESLKGWWNNNKSLAAEAAAAETTTIGSTDTAKEIVGVDTEDIKSPPNDKTVTSDAVVSAKDISLADNDAPERNASDPVSPPLSLLESATAVLASRIHTIYESLPPCTAFIIYSGSGDPREMSRLQAIQQAFKREFKVKKWDQLTAKWTDVEEQALKRAARQARDGIGFVCVK
jgi:RNA exonuclease 1